MAVKINSLSIENTKRVKAVALTPAENGLTIIGGNNNQGKTSVLDAIAWALGGEKYRPSHPAREGSTVPPRLELTLSNGLRVERSGKNSALKVTDPAGKRSGQSLLDEFVSTFALDLPRFMDATDREKANILLRVIGVGDELARLERAEQEVYNERLALGRIAEQKTKYARELPGYPDCPAEPVSAMELIRRQQEILARNGENQRKRARVQELNDEADRLDREVKALSRQLTKVLADLQEARKDAATLRDESTAKLEADIEQIDAINARVRANLEKERAEDEARQYNAQYDAMTAKINDIRRDKTKLLGNAPLPLPGLSVENSVLLYNGQPWDNMSGSDRLRVATAIVRCLNPNCGFVLLDKLEQMDTGTLAQFAAWLEQEGLQAIATRVSTGDECTILIEDGYAKAPEEPAAKKWKAGEF